MNALNRIDRFSCNGVQEKEVYNESDPSPKIKQTVLNIIQMRLYNSIERLDKNVYTIANGLQRFFPYDELCNEVECNEVYDPASSLQELSYTIDKIDRIIEKLEFCNRHLAEIV